MKRLAERRGEPLEVHTRFDSSRLADVCLSDAYSRLVPRAHGSLGRPAHAHTSAQAASQQRQGDMSCLAHLPEEDRQCS